MVNDTGILSPGKILAIVLTVIGLLAGTFVATESFESVDAHEILVVQSPIHGQLSWYTTPGIKYQGFGKVTTLPKVFTYSFSSPIRFNDGGSATVVGSIQFRMPADSANLTNIYTTFGSPAALGSSLLQVVTDKSIFMTGPLLSSTESYAEKRSNLILWIEDQITTGVYKTIRKDIKAKDPITGEEKTITVAEIAINSDGKPARQESSQLVAFGITPFNFAVKNVHYDDKIEKQIMVQQENIMAVQTAVAQSRKAEQQTLTAEQEGKATATKAKWEQETIKAQKVTEAQQKFEVSKLDAQSAAQEKQANILRGEGEAARRRLVMAADNALDKRAEVYLKVNELWANAIATYAGSWVPTVVMGGNGTAAPGSGATALMEMLTAKTAQDLGLNLKMPNRVTPESDPKSTTK